MIYSKNSLYLAIKHILPGVNIDPIAYDSPANLFEIFSVISEVYFIISDEELEEMNPSIKYAFRVIREAAREFDKFNENTVIEYGTEEIDLLGDPLKVG